MATTPDLGISLVAASQAQPEITHNEAILRLQALLIGASDWLSEPPASPTAGDVYLITDSPTGAWASHANKVTMYYGGSWLYIPDVDSNGTNITMGARQEGLQIYLRSTSSPGGGLLLRWSGSAWVAA